MNAAEIQRLAHFEQSYWWHRARRTIVSRLLRRFVQGASDHVLDVGCGAGGTSVVLRELGRVCCVDFGRDAVEAARSRGLEVAQMDATNLAVRPGAFDVAVALDVLEHLDDDAAAARELFCALRPGGLLLVTVPAYQWLWSSHDVALGHRRRYARRQVETLLRDGGFDVELCSYVMAAALPPAAAVRLIERLPGRKPASGAAESGYTALPRLVNEVLARVVGVDGLLAGRIPMLAGLSVAAVARRPLT